MTPIWKSDKKELQRNHFCVFCSLARLRSRRTTVPNNLERVNTYFLNFSIFFVGDVLPPHTLNAARWELYRVVRQVASVIPEKI